MRASRPLEVTVAVYPTLVLTNALPYDMDIVVWQVMLCPCTCLCCTAMLPVHIQVPDLLSHSRTVCNKIANSCSCTAGSTRLFIAPDATSCPLALAVACSTCTYRTATWACHGYAASIRKQPPLHACAMLSQPAHRTITIACMCYAVSASVQNTHLGMHVLCCVSQQTKHSPWHAWAMLY